MDKKAIYTILGLGAVAAISYQTWYMINKNDFDNGSGQQMQKMGDNDGKGEKNGYNGKNQNQQSEIVVESTTEDNTILSVTKPYTVEGDNNTLTLKVTLNDQIIRDIVISHYDDSPKSKQKHDMFVRQVNLDQVIGVAITDAEISNVTGASYTSRTFNQILDDIANNL